MSQKLSIAVDVFAICSALVALFVVAFPAMAAEELSAGKLIKVYPEEETRLPYWLYLPREYDDSEDKYPLLLFLHGSGERGNDLDRVLNYGLPKRFAKGEHYPFIMIAPQCPNDSDPKNREPDTEPKEFWATPDTIDRAKNIIDYEIERLGRVDEDRVYVTGLSMGGYGTYHIVGRHPEVFAAAAPICGAGDGWLDYEAVAHVPFWAFHGEKDRVVKLADQQKTVDALKAAGASVRFTIYPNVGHRSWDRTYANPELFEWLLAQKREQKEE